MSDLLADQPHRRLQRDDREYLLLGTAHVSKISAEVVAAEVASGGHERVAIELDAGRLRAIEDARAFESLDLFQVIRQGRVGMVAAQLALAGYQRRIAEQFGIEPGAEMRAAIDGARGRGLPLDLIDRDVGLTLARCAAALGFWGKARMLSGVLASLFEREEISEAEVEKLKQGDVLAQVFGDFASEAPALHQALIAERDRYMAAKLRLLEGPGRKVLAVVGAGHLAGLARHLEEDREDPRQVLAELEQKPPPSRIGRLIGLGLMAVLLGGLVVGFSRGFEVGGSLLGVYLAMTAGGAALGALLALAHPLAILAGAISAPLTVLHPLLASGMFSAGAELLLRKPTIADLKGLRDDAGSIAGWRRNRATRVLLVFVLTNLGTALAVWFTVGYFFRQLS